MVWWYSGGSKHRTQKNRGGIKNSSYLNTYDVVPIRVGTRPIGELGKNGIRNYYYYDLSRPSAENSTTLVWGIHVCTFGFTHVQIITRQELYCVLEFFAVVVVVMHAQVQLLCNIREVQLQVVRVQGMLVAGGNFNFPAQKKRYVEWLKVDAYARLRVAFCTGLVLF